MAKSISVPYGDSEQILHISNEVNVTVVNAPQRDYESAEILLERALRDPINSPHLEELVTPKDRIVIIVNDQTRPGPTKLIV